MTFVQPISARHSTEVISKSRQMSPPLDLKSKPITLVHWAGMGRKLSACDLCVLIFLVQRQNTKTGRCDPSVACLMRDTGYSERSIRASTTKLEQLGAITRQRKGKWERNRFTIQPVDKDTALERLTHNHDVHTNYLDWQDLAENAAGYGPTDMQNLAPKKRKENRKRKVKECLDASGSRNSAGKGQRRSADQSLTIGRQEFERRAAASFENIGIGYSGLIQIQSKQFEIIYRRYADEELSFEESILRLIEAYEKE